MAAQYFPRSREPSAIALRTETLVARYPNLSEIELAELINLMSRLPILDFGLMTADDNLAGKMGAFQRDHGVKVGSQLTAALAVLVVPAVIALGLTWWALS
jgi:hypothetical protein